MVLKPYPPYASRNDPTLALQGGGAQGAPVVDLLEMVVTELVVVAAGPAMGPNGAPGGRGGHGMVVIRYLFDNCLSSFSKPKNVYI